ncbi:unnamed protein product [Chrysoparadoxa australica]
MSSTDTSLEGQRVFIPDDEIGWVRATVLKAHGDGDKFDVNVDKVDGAAQSGTVTVSLKHPDFGTLESLPLQNDESGQRHGTADMTELNYLHEPAILYNLAKRFSVKLPYTYTGEICIAVNPYQWLNIYTDELRAQYSHLQKKADLPPHVYATSAAAFRGLKVYERNQSILVSGESGAGKTETVKILLNFLATVAGADKPDIIDRVVMTNPLLESFGNAKTTRNDNSSRFGKFTELQFGKSCALIGSSVNTYLLEKTRVVHHAEGERTYHVFYQVLSAPQEVKDRLGLGDRQREDFYYTSMGQDASKAIEGKTDAEYYGLTQKALKLINLNDKTIADMESIIAAVLFLGEIEFDGHEGGDGQEGSSVSNMGEVEAAAKLLGIKPEELCLNLTKRVVKTQHDRFEVSINAEGASHSRDGLAKDAYHRLFNWLVACINKSTGAESTVTGKIGLLDIFGFESFPTNSFEQFCINFTNEKLQQKFTQDVFKTVQTEYETEGIPWSHIGFTDNTETLALIEAHRSGILALLDEECMLPQGSDEAFVNKLDKAHCSHHAFIKDKRKGPSEFSIVHYAGTVQYTCEGFCEKNKDVIQDELVGMLIESTNDLACQIFSTAASKPQVNRKGRGQKKGKDEEKMAHKRKGSLMQESVGNKFKRQLHSLMTVIEQTEVQYVRCIKPNSIKSATVMDNIMVVEQLRCAGVIDAIRISRAAYPNRLPFDEFSFRFKAMVRLAVGRNGLSLTWLCTALIPRRKSSLCDQLITKLIPDGQGTYALGTTKIYFRSGVLEDLEERRGVYLAKVVKIIQRVMLGHSARKRFVVIVIVIVWVRCSSQHCHSDTVVIPQVPANEERYTTCDPKQEIRRLEKERLAKLEAERLAKIEAEKAEQARLAAERAALAAQIPGGIEMKALAFLTPPQSSEPFQVGYSGDPESPRTKRRAQFLAFNPMTIKDKMDSNMRLVSRFCSRSHSCHSRKYCLKSTHTGETQLKRSSLPVPSPCASSAVHFLGRFAQGDTYRVFLEAAGDCPQRFLLCARKKASTKTSYYSISMREGDMDKNSTAFLGKLRATSKTCEEFQLFDNGTRADKGKGAERKELAAIRFRATEALTNGQVFEGPRQMQVPNYMKPTQPDPTFTISAPLLDRMKRGALTDNEPLLVNRLPKWNAKVMAYVLNFHGRVTEASIKNFQLMQDGDDDERIQLQFGKTSDNEFTLDYCWPLSPVQALSVALTSFDFR